MISVRSHRILYGCLRDDDSELALAVLTMLPRVGTAAALPNVDALANGKNKLGINAEVRQAAILCLGLLKERIAEQNTNTLLRASQPEQRNTEFLRPAEGITEIAPEQLLRAAPINEIALPQTVTQLYQPEEQPVQVRLHNR